MNRKNENKPAYNKPSIELITMDSEGSLLLTASTVTMGGGMTGTNAFGGGSIISNRQRTKPASGGATGTTSFGTGSTISNRK